VAPFPQATEADPDKQNKKTDYWSKVIAEYERENG
jgi:hypothetical protein